MVLPERALALRRLLVSPSLFVHHNFPTSSGCVGIGASDSSALKSGRRNVHFTSTFASNSKTLAETSLLGRVVGIHSSSAVFSRPITNINMVLSEKSTTSRDLHTSAQMLKKKGKEKKKTTRSMKPTDPEGDVENVLDVKAAEAAMTDCLEQLGANLQQRLALRTDVRAYTQMKVKLDDGTEHQLDTLAQVVQKTPTLLLLNLDARPDCLTAVRTAVEQSGLNVNVQQQGSTLLLPLVRVTKEYREQLAKNAVGLKNDYKKQLNELFKQLSRSVDSRKSEPGVTVNDVRSAHNRLLDMKKQFETHGDEVAEKKQKQLLQEIR